MKSKRNRKTAVRNYFEFPRWAQIFCNLLNAFFRERNGRGKWKKEMQVKERVLWGKQSRERQRCVLSRTRIPAHFECVTFFELANVRKWMSWSLWLTTATRFRGVILASSRDVTAYPAITMLTFAMIIDAWCISLKVLSRITKELHYIETVNSYWFLLNFLRNYFLLLYHKTDFFI